MQVFNVTKYGNLPDNEEVNAQLGKNVNYLTVERWVEDGELWFDEADLLALEQWHEATEVLQVERVRGVVIVRVVQVGMSHHGAVVTQTLRMGAAGKVQQGGR